MFFATLVKATLWVVVAGLSSHSQPIMVHPRDCHNSISGKVQGQDGSWRDAKSWVQCQ